MVNMVVNSVATIISRYKSIQSELCVEYHLDKVTYDSPVNFNESLETPRHRWFPYKEGFSPSFVRGFFNRYIHNEDFRVLDPFSGVGTTAIEAALIGQNGVGIEVNPLALFVSEAKKTRLTPSDFQEFDKILDEFENISLRELADRPENATVQSYFEPEYLDALLKVKAYFLQIPFLPIQLLFKVAFLSIIETFSTHRKAGNGLKRKTRLLYPSYVGSSPIEKVKHRMLSELRKYESDLAVEIEPSRVQFIEGSSLTIDPNHLPNSINAVLTSPPYANCFDYSKIYMCELWLGDFFTSSGSQRKFRMQSVRSHVHATWPSRFDEMGSDLVNNQIYEQLTRKKLWSRNIPSMLRGYFMDLGQLLSNLHVALDSGSPAGFVVGNSVYGGIPIATDLILADMASSYGFETERIEVFRYIIPSSQQYVQLDNKEYLRESMVVLRKI